MKRLSVLVGAFALSACASNAAAPAVVTEPTVKAATAPEPSVPHFAEGNGAVVEVPVKGATAVALRIAFYTGSVDDPKGKEGLTFLTARLMAEGGTKSATYPELLRALYPMAASIDVQVDKEQTVFFGAVHPDHVERFAELLSEVIQAPRFGEADFARLKADAINDIEKRLKATDDENLGKQMLESMLYDSGHPYGHFVGGTVRGLGAITLDDVKAHAARVFGKRRLLIGMGGAVNEAAKAAVTKALGALPEGAPRVESVLAVKGPMRHEVLIAEKPSSTAVAVSMGFPHFARRGHPDSFALGLVQSYFGEHRQFHGVLMSEIREKRGINYGDYAYVEAFQQEGWGRNAKANTARRRQHFEIWIRPVALDDAVFSVRLALYFLDSLVKGGLTEENVKVTNQFLQGYTRLWEMTPMRRLGYALDDHFYGTTAWLDTYRAALDGLTAEDVNAALVRHLIPGPLKIAIVAPNADALKWALVSGEKTPRKYAAQPPAEVLAKDDEVWALPLDLQAEDIRVVKAEELFVQ